MSLRIYDAQGRLVRELVHGRAQAGAFTIEWDGRDRAARRTPEGLYFCRLDLDGKTLTRRMTRLK